VAVACPVQGVRIDLHFGPELSSAGYLDQDRVLDHNGTVARAVATWSRGTANGGGGWLRSGELGGGFADEWLLGDRQQAVCNARDSAKDDAQTDA